MKKDCPADFAKAVQLEKEIQRQRPDFFLHRSLQPLDTVEFDTAQLSMISGTAENSCIEGCFT